MEFPKYLGLLIMAVSCSSSQTSEPARGSQQDAGRLPPFREECVYFESLVFADKAASSLKGYTLVETARDLEGLEGVQVAARALSNGHVRYDVTKPDGSFDLGQLPEGRYEVWTCLDGFDELRFQLTIDDESQVDGLDVHLRAAESGGGSVGVFPVTRIARRRRIER